MVKSPIRPAMDAYIDDESFVSETMLLKSIENDEPEDTQTQDVQKWEEVSSSL